MLEVVCKLAIALDNSINGDLDLRLLHAPVDGHVDDVLNEPLRVLSVLVPCFWLHISELGCAAEGIYTSLEHELHEQEFVWDHYRE